ncbi:uncharacterized protein TRIADDRAFT_15044, partial [Trichoplax adhaerens]
RYQHTDRSRLLQISCQVLGVKQDDSLDHIKSVYHDLVKKLHPDSSSGQANLSQFVKVQNAYKTILTQALDDPDEIEELTRDMQLDEFENKVLQHRTKLSTDPATSTASPEEKQATLRQRMDKAVEETADYHVRLVDNMTVEMNIQQKYQEPGRKGKIVQSIDRIAEDFIQQAVQGGQFDNLHQLEGYGKPLKEEHEGLLDGTEYRLNKMLVNSGYAPNWILLGKEIREDKKFLRARLEDRAEQVQKKPRCNEKQLNWKRAVKFVEEQTIRINENVDKYNMHVPLLKMQTVRFDLNREMEKVKK